MALSKRNLIKRSKSYFRRRSINVNITIVDLSGVMSIARGKHRGGCDPIADKFHYYHIEPRESGVGKLMEDVL